MSEIFYAIIMGVVSGLVSGGTIRVQITTINKKIKKMREDIDILFSRRSTDERHI